MRGISARDLAHDLANRAEELFRLAVADAKPYGAELRGHGPDGGVVSMALHGRKRGRWSNWQDPGQHGDCLDFVRHLIVGGSPPEAYQWALRWLGGHQYVPTPRAAPVPSSIPGLGATTPLWRVREIYVAASHAYREPVARYLAGRLGQPIDVPMPLRYAASCYHARDTGKFPAMVAPLLSLAHRQHVGTHVTYLEQTKNSGWGKSRIPPPRKIFGAYHGAVIPLIGNLADLIAGERVLIGEGIENTLAGHIYCERDPPAHVWAAASLGNLSALTLPAATGVTLVRDNDAGNEAAARLFELAVARLIEQGCVVDVIAAPAGYADMADYIQRAAADA